MSSKRYRPRHAGTSHTGWARVLFIIAGAVLCAFTAGNLLVGNRSLGVWLPAVTGAPLLLYGIFRPACDRWFATRFGRIVRVIVIVLYLLALACLLFACTLMIGAAGTAPAAGADAVIVLGAGVHGEEVTDTLEKRLDRAIGYYRENPDTLIVVTGGMGSNENITEAEAMRRYLTEHGIPEAAILTEGEASNTRENFENSKKLLDARLGEEYTTVFVTNDFHVWRAGREAARAGLQNVQGLATPTPILTVPGSYMRETAAIVLGMLSGKFSI